MSDEQKNGNGTLANVDSKPVENAPMDESKKKNIEEYQKLMKEGDRLFFLNDIDTALDAFSDAARLADVIFGVLHPDTYEVYYKYGNCLFLYAAELYPVVRMNNNDEAESSDENEEDEEGDKSTDEKEEDEEEQGTSEQTSGEEKPSSTNDETILAEKEGNEDDEQSLDEFEHIIQDAWNVFEVAKKTCDRVIDTLESEETKKMWELRRSEVFCYLGKVMLLSDQPQAAKDEFNNALTIMQKYLSEDDRQLSSLYFDIGKAYEHGNEYNEAKPYYEKSLNTLKKRVEVLEASNGNEKEISELKSLCDEIQEKLQDVDESAKSSAAFREFAESKNTKPLSKDDKINENVNDVSDLVRKRTAPHSSDPTDKEIGSKKPKNE